MALYIQLSTQNVFTKYLSISSITGGNSVNTEQLTSTIASLTTNSVVPPFISTQALFASSVTTSSLTTESLIGSSLTTSSITANSVTSGVMSTLVLYASSIVGVTTGGGGIASIPSILSTFAILTSSLQVSTVVANTLSTQQLFTSSLQGNNLIASNIFVSSGVLSTFSTNAVNFASGFGYLTMPDIYPNSVYTSTVTTSNLLVGTNSVISPIQFFGFGTYSNTVISELSTGGTTQELLFFRGSNASDRIRMQTTGSVVFEPGVSARIWPTAPSNVTPAMIINTSSNVGIQTATPGTALDVAGTSRAVILSSQQLFASSIQTTNLLINGTGVARFTGSISTNQYGSGVDTFTLQASTSAYSTGVASLAFANNTSSYPLGRMYAIDSAFSASSISQLVFQTVPTPASTFSTVYTAIGSTQSFTVPLGVSLLQVSMWGAGGSGGNGGPGGAGAFLQGLLSVNPGQQLNLIVGQGGVFNSVVSSFGGGGSGSNQGYTGSGGGRSGIQLLSDATIVSSSGAGGVVTYTTSLSHELQAGEPVIISGLSPPGFNGTFAVLRVISANQFAVTNAQTGSSTGTGAITAEVVTVGAGGAGPQNSGGTNGGAGTFSGTAFTAPSVYGGGGGSQTAGGAGGTSGSLPGPTAGSILQGGAGSLAGGGGGGGYYGGGGGGWTSGVGNGGGGGGSSYISNGAFTFLTGSNSPNSSNTAPATTSPFYRSGVAAGGAANANGGGGLLVFASIGGFLSESMRINSNGYVGIQNNTPRTALDVGGTGRFLTLSTLQLNVSSINGQLIGGPINSSIIGLGQIYPSTTSMMSSINRSISSFSTALGAIGGGVTAANLQSTTSQLQSNITNWSQYPTTSDIILSNTTGITVQDPNNALQLKSEYVNIRGLQGGYGNLSLATASFLTSSSLESYSLGFSDLVTGTVSSFFIGRSDGVTLTTAPIYISSVYFGDVGGTVAGQLTTDGTATDIFWNGSKLNNQSGGSGGGAIDYISAFTVSTGSLEVSTISSYTIFAYGVIANQFVNLQIEPMDIASLYGDIRLLASSNIDIRSDASTIVNANEISLNSSNEIRVTAVNNVYMDGPQVIANNIFVNEGISTHSLVIYGPSTLTVQGLSYFQNIVSTQTLITTSLGIIDSATGGTSYIQTSNGSLSVNNLSTSELTISSLNIIDGNTGIINSLYVSSGFLNFNTSTLNGSTSQNPVVSGVTQIIAGTNVTISPVDGLGIVTINAAGGGGGGGGEPVPYLSSYSLSTGSLNVSSLTTFSLNASTMSRVNIAAQPSTSLWVAVGRDTVANNRIKYSYNGITWLNSLSGGAFTTGGCNVAWDGKLWVAVGNDTTANNRIKYSGDGKNWSNSLGLSFSSGPKGIGTNGRMWVAVGQDVTAPAADIKYSYDGITWSNGTGAVLNAGEAVAWNGKMWVACANAVANETLLYSYNGINWSTSVSGGFSLGGKAAAWNGRMWVTVGQDAVQNNMIKYSYDGMNWSNSLGTGFTSQGWGVAWNGRMWVAVGDDATQNNTIKYSYDGMNWSNSLGTGFSVVGYSIAWNGSMWVATGSDATQNNTIKYSYDGITWSNSAGTGFGSSGRNGVAFNSNVVPSYNQTNFEIEPQNIPVFFRSTNQMSFTQSSIILNNTLFIDSLNKVGINTGNPQTDLDVVGVGRFQTLSSIQLNTLEVSVSSITTNQLAVSSFTTLQATVSSINQVNIVQSNPLWVAVGTNATLAGNIKYSSDGFNWNHSLGSGFSVSGNDVAWNGLMWVAVGIDATAANTLKYSYDGANWLNSAGSGFSYSGNGVAWNGRLWVAVGTDTVQNNRIKYSGDGINWSNSAGTAFNGSIVGGIGIAWNGKLWVALGSDTTANNRIKYSYDGINWSNSLGASFTSNAYGAAWNGRMWVAAGQDTTPANTLKYSFDGITWSNSLGTGFTTRGTHVAWNGNLWVVTGADSTQTNTIKYSGDGINWSNSLGAGFSPTGTSVAWNGKMWIVVGNTSTRNINYSYDGVRWITQGLVFSGSASGIAFNSNVVPSYNQTNFEIEPQNIPVFLRSTNQISFTQSSIILNNSMFIDATNKVGINTGNPQTDLDVNGSGRFQTVSTLNINVSTILGNQITFQRAYLSNVLIGTQSTVNSAQYNGLFGNYNNTVLSEISTGGGTQEFLVFKGSSTSDRIRFQTTGSFVVETGVSARLWSDTTVPTLSNTTPAMIINSSSNVGIQTATPGATLDVAGTGRFITASSISMYTGALYTGVYFI